MKVAALIPAYNEEGAIRETVAALLSCQQLNEIVVINDGSSDRTAEYVGEIQGVTLLDLPVNRGKGSALNAGWSKTEADVYLLLDGDLGQTAHYAANLLPPVLEDRADMTIARFGPRQGSGDKAMGFGCVRRFASFTVWLLTGVKPSSPLSGQRAIRKEVLDKLGGFLPGFGVEIGLTVGALHHGFRLQEIPLPMTHRAYGRGLTGMAHRGRQFVHVLRAFWACLQKGWIKRC